MSDRQNVRAIVINGDKLLVMKHNKFGDQYYTLIGGGIEDGEDHETALRREISEETGMQVGSLHHVFTEQSAQFGMQYAYTCEYIGGDPELATDSEEAASNAFGGDTYQPTWLPISELSNVLFRSEVVRQALLAHLQAGFPETPLTLAG